ncbi:hypothetical protein [Sphingomonas psychrotolerans]|uniref:Uncharacterized protein n=1 Tax=Sphingomonas psychrotolerans TaxID=1327635 RepID=A0A2K8MBB9_9SPHN|nr:hypothetical protein [Sphingomonas psychrotolerans]ATY31153.1 hypothetical protein CVN68_03460 [Sphingomonas psychrotolerans]
MTGILPLLLATVAVTATSFASAASQTAQRKPDLADIAAGTYEGAVVADTRGGSQSDVTITVKRVAKNVVEVSSDYDRVPTVRIGLTRAMDAILAARPGNGFLIEQAKDPRRLDLSIDGATLIVRKQD